MGRGLRACCFAGRTDATLSFKEAAGAAQQPAEQRASSQSCFGDVLGLLPADGPLKDVPAPLAASKASACPECTEERIPAAGQQPPVADIFALLGQQGGSPHQLAAADAACPSSDAFGSAIQQLLHGSGSSMEDAPLPPAGAGTEPAPPGAIMAGRLVSLSQGSEAGWEAEASPPAAGQRPDATAAALAAPPADEAADWLAECGGSTGALAEEPSSESGAGAGAGCTALAASVPLPSARALFVAGAPAAPQTRVPPSWSSDGGEGADPLAAMHDRALRQRREAEQRHAQLRQQQEAAELGACTFHPTLLTGGRSPSRPGSTASLATSTAGGAGSGSFGEAAGSAMYARQQAQRQRQLERLAAQRAEQEREALAPCTFRPAVDAGSQRMFASGVRYGGSRLVAGGRSVDDAVHRQLRLLHSAGLNAAAAAAVLASQGLVSADDEHAQPEGGTPAPTASQPVPPEAAAEAPTNDWRGDLSGAAIPSALQQAAVSPTRRQLSAVSSTAAALLSPAAVGRPLSASARLYAHAVNLQERQRQEAAVWEQKQRAELLAASPRAKPFPRAQHTHPLSPPLSRRSPPISRPGSAPPPGLLCTSLEQAAAGLAATGPYAGSPAAGQALVRSTTIKAASYWQRWGLEPGADFDGFLQRQEKFVQALGAKLDAERQLPAALQAAASPGAHVSPGSRRLLERRRQRDLARQMEAAGCMRVGMAGCDANAHPSDTSPLSHCAPEHTGTGSSSEAGPVAPFPFRPAITARAAAKAARTPEEMHAEAARHQEKLAQCRREAAAAALAPCTFAPDIALATGSPLSAKFASKAKGHIDLQDLGGYMREVREKQAAREEAAAAAAKARQEQELAQCTFQPNLAHGQRSPTKRGGAAEAAAAGPQPCADGGLAGKAARPPDVLAQVQALLRGESAAEAGAGSGMARSGAAATAAVVGAQQGAVPVGSEHGASGPAPAAAGGAGFSAFLSQVTEELRKLQAE